MRHQTELHEPLGGRAREGMVNVPAMTGGNRKARGLQAEHKEQKSVSMYRADGKGGLPYG